ncbi:hypothetical protein HGRIS_003759 [Hohenbuehelia grisea]|uniref:Zf-C3HC-domain-containing protein n=1 Tax=Hohenbuehelia grisea TaxID=104357 RepID=A0ABR3JGF4_9AGAR
MNDVGVSQPPEDASATAIRATKRKLDDAFYRLDDAVRSTENVVQQPLAKRPHISRSLYSTLAKYGITSSKDKKLISSPSDAPVINVSLSKPTPNLTAIINRAATRTRKLLPFKFSAPSSAAVPAPSGAEYRPSSLPSFLARLATFKLSTYANKPKAIDAVAAARCGWVNDGKDRLVCGLCNASWVVAGREGMTKDAANTLVEKQTASLASAHKDGCPWKTRQCDSSIYRIPLKPPGIMALDIKVTAAALDEAMRNVEVAHPLTPVQLSSLLSAMQTIEIPTPDTRINLDVAASISSRPLTPLPTTTTDPSESALLVGLFGWKLLPPAPAEQRKLPSYSRASSVFRSAPATPSISRASSVQPFRGATPTPGPSTPRRLSGRLLGDDLGPKQVGNKNSTLLHCELCQRRVGLWAFSVVKNPVAEGADAMDVTPDVPQPKAPPPTPSRLGRPSTSGRPFDLLKEHRAYCPYIVRSTIVPSLPVPPSTGNSASSSTTPSATSGMFVFGQPSFTQSHGNLQGSNTAMEGWRAVLTVVLRHGLSERQRELRRIRSLNQSDGSGVVGGLEVPEEEPDAVEAMVEGVKKRGGKDLLRYVKGLLG